MAIQRILNSNDITEVKIERLQTMREQALEWNDTNASEMF
jgi:hypothetical protein